MSAGGDRQEAGDYSQDLLMRQSIPLLDALGQQNTGRTTAMEGVRFPYFCPHLRRRWWCWLHPCSPQGQVRARECTATVQGCTAGGRKPL